MKTVFLFFITLVAVSQTDAQLLKKLKDKAVKTIEPKETASASTTETGDTKSEAAPTNQSTGTPTMPAVPPSNGSVVFTLAPDESLLYDESKILTKNNKVNYSFVVQNKKYEYFLIEDGNRTGPFKEAPIRSSKTSDAEDSGSGNGDEVSIGNDKKDAVAIQYSKTIEGKLYLVFNGKNYGPYDYVSKMILSPDKKHFFALVTIGSESPMMAKMGMGNTFIVNEAGLKKAVGTGGMSMPARFAASDGFKHCMATVMDQKTQKIITVTSTGKEEEGSMTDLYSGGTNKSFVSDDGDIISIPSQSPTQVMVNGKEVAAFKVPIKSMDRLFLTPDIKKSVYYENGKIYRANGSEESLTGVVFPKVTTVNNETAVYYFKLFKNDNGAKDVYLCKKVI